MTDAPRIEVRVGAAADIAHFPTAAPFARAPRATILVATRGAALVAAVVLDPDGSAPAPGVPRLHVALAEKAGEVSVPSSAWPIATLAPLLDAAATVARAEGSRRMVIAVDTMDLATHRTLAELGFVPSGEWPYFHGASAGVGPVEHVMGYRDPVGSVVDLVRTIED